MTNYSGQLRQVRSETIPQIPELAPNLRINQNVILEFLKDRFAKDGDNPDRVDSVDWNKTERHTIVGFLIHKQMDFLVEGEGSTAHFRNFLVDQPDRRDSKEFMYNLKITQALSARYTKWLYDGKKGSEGEWYSAAAKRYRNLGFSVAGLCLSRKAPLFRMDVPVEGIFLGRGLRTAALRSTLNIYLAQILEKTEDFEKEEKRQAAHDLAFSALSMAGIHFFELLENRPHIQGDKIIKDKETGKYRAIYTEENAKHQRLQRVKKLPNTTLKCPANIKNIDSSSPLQNAFHAGINAAFDFGYYHLDSNS